VVGVAAHVAMDFLTPYGTRVLSPFTWRWAATDWMPIVDVYILAILLAGLVLGWNPKIRRRAAVLALALAAAHCCTRAVMHERALAELPHVFGAALPPPCEPSAGRGTISVWPRDRDPSWRPASGRCLVDAAALPTFTSPFRWRLVVRLADSYEVRELDLAEGWLPTQASSRPQGSATAQHRPDQWTPAVARASETRVARVFLGFSRYPAARVAVDPDGTTTVRWTDIRFDDDRAPQQATRARANLFSATVRIGPDGALLEERLGQ
jgi:hypothetical protein